ncbi:ferritin family protein [Anaeropeptidivorans aminofermentans]|uniref:ferritin family protein n=1 Tax=Anaeropeptidivorans aminofermentans TaxID=2934315 RepID=UPI0020250F11|nr:ferritin family protein [Anaeropeptidivorans aminofermentans]MBE6013245.1 hypothetical protein [Lachnospiraceae bacterium]
MDQVKRYQLTPAILLRLMNSEQNSAANYNLLMKMAPDKSAYEIIEAIYEEELLHLEKLNHLYKQTAWSQPKLKTPEKPSFSKYIDGLKQSILEELDTYNEYCNIYTDNSNADLRNTFFSLLSDENRHAAKLNYLYTNFIEKLLL